jgi:hypothetical protein
MDESMFPPIFYSTGIEDALRSNAQLGAEQAAHPSFGKRFGNFLAAWAGSLGDNLTGNPVYANSQKAAQEAQEYARRRQDELSDYEAKKKIDQRYQAPDLPGLADEFNWFSSLPPQLQSAVSNYMSMRYPAQSSPVTQPYGSTVTGGGSAPALRYNPQTGRWEQEGGAGGNASGGFL